MTTPLYSVGLRASLSAIAAAAALAGCSFIPTYQRPSAPVAASWPVSAGPTADAGQAAADLPWQEFVQDEQLRQLIALALALVGNFDSVLSAWREDNAFGLDSRLLANAARASVRSEIAEEVADYTESGIPASTALAEVFGELPELRDAMNLAWRVLVLWLAVIALFVVAGWVG